MNMSLMLIALLVSLSASLSAEEAVPKPADAYPLKVCVVSGEELGSMGDPVVIEHDGTTVKFCCKSCVKKFNKEPALYLAKLKVGNVGEVGKVGKVGKAGTEAPDHSAPKEGADADADAKGTGRGMGKGKAHDHNAEGHEH